MPLSNARGLPRGTRVFVFVQELSSENKNLTRLFYIFNLVRVTGCRFPVDHPVTAHLGRKVILKNSRHADPGQMSNKQT